MSGVGTDLSQELHRNHERDPDDDGRFLTVSLAGNDRDLCAGTVEQDG
jgi:hypothetical protein